MRQRWREGEKKCELITILSCSSMDFICALIKTVQLYISSQSAPIFVAIVWLLSTFFFFARWNSVYIVLCDRKKAVDNWIIFSFLFDLVHMCVCLWHFRSEYVLFRIHTFFSRSLQIHLVHLAVLLNCNQPIWNALVRIQREQLFTYNYNNNSNNEREPEHSTKWNI